MKIITSERFGTCCDFPQLELDSSAVSEFEGFQEWFFPPATFPYARECSAESFLDGGERAFDEKFNGAACLSDLFFIRPFFHHLSVSPMTFGLGGGILIRLKVRFGVFPPMMVQDSRLNCALSSETEAMNHTPLSIALPTG